MRPGGQQEWVGCDEWDTLMRVGKVVIRLIEKLYEDLRRWEAVEKSQRDAQTYDDHTRQSRAVSAPLVPIAQNLVSLQDALTRVPSEDGRCLTMAGLFSDGAPQKGGRNRWLASVPLLKMVTTFPHTCLTSYNLPNLPPILVVFSTSQPNQQNL